MTVLLEGAIQRFIGKSADGKPLKKSDGTALPAGSSFLETDTGKIYRFDGTEWQHHEPENEVAELLKLVLLELHELKNTVQLVTS